LDPFSMQMNEEDLDLQARLCVQHCKRVGDAVTVTAFLTVVVYVSTMRGDKVNHHKVWDALVRGGIADVGLLGSDSAAAAMVLVPCLPRNAMVEVEVVASCAAGWVGLVSGLEAAPLHSEFTRVFLGASSPFPSENAIHVIAQGGVGMCSIANGVKMLDGVKVAVCKNRA
jgi:enamine deaminase RidA (YjgF/YER057c/UK114 family)